MVDMVQPPWSLVMMWKLAIWRVCVCVWGGGISDVGERQIPPVTAPAGYWRDTAKPNLLKQLMDTQTKRDCYDVLLHYNAPLEMPSSWGINALDGLLLGKKMFYYNEPLDAISSMRWK